MKNDLEEQVRAYAVRVVDESDPVHLGEALAKVYDAELGVEVGRRARPRVPRLFPLVRRNSWAAGLAAAAVVLLLGLTPFLLGGGEAGDVTDDLAQPESPTVPQEPDLAVGQDPSEPTLTVDPLNIPPNPTSAPLRGEWVEGDDGSPRKLMEADDALWGGNYLDFLAVDYSGKFLDARFYGPGLPDAGDGAFRANTPFFVRHGFVNSGPGLLGPEYDVEVYVVRQEGPDLGDGIFQIGQTYRYTSDYVVMGMAEKCGPTFAIQTGPVDCERYIHNFPEGLPEGRYDLWAVWTAPCSAWVEMGLIDSCADPSEVVTHFAASVNSPLYSSESGLASPGDPGDGESSGFWPWQDPAFWNRSGNPTTVDPAGVSIPGDDGTAPLPLGTIDTLPVDDYLDFLSKDCEECFLDARFFGPELSEYGSGPFVANRHFVVRHGFVAGPDPLGPDYSVNLYITRWTGAQGGPFELGQTYMFTPDFVMRGMTDRCGPTHDSLTGPVECEWFVHDFPEGLPEGRYDLWADWVAPCSAWVDMGLTESCADPGETMSLFSASVNSPFGPDEGILDDRGVLFGWMPHQPND